MTLFKDFITLHRGYDLPHKKRNKGKIPVISSTGIVDTNDKAKVKGPGVVTGRSGTIGKVFFENKDFWPLNTTLFVSDFKGNDPLYVFYWLQAFNLRHFVSGSTVPTLNRNDLSYLDVDIPDVNVQKKSVQLLKEIDKKIANNNAISKELESMAKTIYDYWFLQFEFPDKDGKLYKSNGGKMVWNDQLKQNIPEGWKVKDINELCKIVDCLHSKKPNYKYESVSSYLLTLENIGKYHLVDNSKKYYISSQDYKKWTSRIEVHEGDFVVTNAGRAGDIARVPAGIKSAIGRNLTAIRPEKISSYYLTMFFRSIYMKKQILSNLDLGSFFKSYNVKSIKKIRILVPDDNTMNIFLKICVPLLKKIEILMKENHKLKSLRDFLLPMLMNGQVTITN